MLLLGDEQSGYLGLNVTQRRVLILVLGSLLTSVAVALSGLIAFVGLLVPHLARLLFGANHRLLLPASILLGAIFLLVADTLARMVLAPQELPVGLLESGAFVAQGRPDEIIRREQVIESFLGKEIELTNQ